MRGVSGLLLLVAIFAQVLFAQERVDVSVIERIRREALQNSQVMEHAFFLCDVYGPRLTGSPGFQAAGAWVIKRLQDFGLENVRKEQIGWGRSWSYTKFSVHMLEPQRAALIGSPGPWSSGVNGQALGEPILAPAPTDVTRDTYEKYAREYRGRLKGKFVFLSPPAAIQPQTSAPFKRFTDDELSQLSRSPAPPSSPSLPPSLIEEFRIWGSRLNQFFIEEGVIGLIRQSRGDGGMVVSFGPDWARESTSKLAPTLFLAAEHYNRIVRLLQRDIPVRLALEMETSFLQDPSSAFNITAEIPGGLKKDEVVMIGAHLDSWTGGTGATDDAAGCAIVMEATRILKALGVKPVRTIRIVLWGGHEGAGIGSATYVSEHFGNSDNPKPEYAKLSCYFNLDNGAGKVRGIYLPQRDEGLRLIFQAWLELLKEMGATTIIPIAAPSGSDHATFYQAGLPGVMFIQDPLDYRSLTRHSNMDLYDRLQVEDLKQAAAVVASFAYQAAMREELLPRNPLAAK
jgi:carboxypeptidase Q